LVKVVRGWQITLPIEMREEVGLELGSYLEAQVSNGTISLKPVKLVSPADADRRLEEILSRVKYTGSQPAPSEEEILSDVVDIIHQMRRENAEGGAR
jgi:bifunctional DNA-binding transcriptional regulator/antitoxin component of YhaV-PrlF toxin-antitoxin module